MALDLDRTDRFDRSGPDSRGPKTSLSRGSFLPRGVVAAVGVGVAFGLGIVAGGGIGQARGEAEDTVTSSAEADILRRADMRSRVLDEKRERLKLTYATELVKPEAPVVERAIERQKQKQETRSAAASDEVAAALEPPPAPLPAAPADAKPEGPAGAHRDDVEHDADRDEDRDGDRDGDRDADRDVDDDAKASPAAQDKPDAHRLQAALARVLGEAPAVVDPAPVAKTFALQVASAPTRAGAEALAKKLETQGHQVRVVEGDVGGKAVFRVRVGAFADRADADAYKARLTTPAFVVAE